MARDGDIDQISAAIGELRAEVRIGAEQRGQMMQTLRSMDEKLDMVPPLVEKVNEMAPHVESWKKWKQRIVGGAFVVGGGSGGLGAWLSNLLNRGGS